ncbi:hypothetical protein ACQUY5_18610 [Bacillus cereus]|uniref:hypothetical protein n=1 Tax=Bacillus cereus TaxID=1396 RepID=UPI003D16B00E
MKAEYTVHVMKLLLGFGLATSIIMGLVKDFSINPIEVIGVFVLVLVTPNYNLAWKDLVAKFGSKK